MTRLLRAAMDWVMVTLPDACSGWLLQAYRRPFVFLLAVVVLPLAILFVTAQTVNTALWRRQSLHNLHVTARLASEIVDETLGETFRFEQMLAAEPAFADALRRRDQRQLSQRLQEAMAFLPRVDLVTAISPEGIVVASAPSRPELPGRIVVEEEFFLGARQGGWRPYVSAVYLRDEPPPAKVVSVVLPVMQGEKVVGLVQFQHLVEEIKSWLQKLRVEPDGFLYVVDHRSQLVVHPFQLLPGKPKIVSDWPPVAQPLPPEGTSLAFTDRKGRRWLSGVHAIGQTGWRVVAVQPEASALKVLHQVLWPLGMLMGALALLLVLLSHRWAQLQESSMNLLRQNTKLLKQLQQRKTLGPGRKEGSDP